MYRVAWFDSLCYCCLYEFWFVWDSQSWLLLSFGVLCRRQEQKVALDVASVEDGIRQSQLTTIIRWLVSGMNSDRELARMMLKRHSFPTSFSGFREKEHNNITILHLLQNVCLLCSLDFFPLPLLTGGLEIARFLTKVSSWVLFINNIEVTSSEACNLAYVRTCSLTFLFESNQYHWHKMLRPSPMQIP